MNWSDWQTVDYLIAAGLGVLVTVNVVLWIILPSVTLLVTPR